RSQAPGHTLQPTALVHEAYLRLAAGSNNAWRDRAHFFRTAARAMRQVLTDHARSKCAAKRGGAVRRVEFSQSLDYSSGKASELVAVDEALQALADFDERKAQAVELRYFGGLSLEETAEAMNVSMATVGREIRYAEAWLRRKLQEG